MYKEDTVSYEKELREELLLFNKYLPLHFEAAAAEDTLIFHNILHNIIITIKLHNIIIISNIY